MKLTRKNLKEIVKEEVKALRKEVKLNEAAVPNAWKRQLQRAEKFLGPLAEQVPTANPAVQAAFVIQSLLPAVGVNAEAFLQNISRMKGEAGKAPGEEPAPEAAPEEELPPGSRY
tara:strand:- start:817 stop:1161 length:345 start_codon:yes stop_codon:yes gene_type:complete